MGIEASSLTSANKALRDGRLEEAVTLYAAASEAMPELAEHINFNVRWLSRTLQPDDESTVIAASTLHPPTGKSLPSDEVLIIVLTQTFARGGEAARLLAKRANHRVGALALLEGTASTADALVYILRTSTARYALIVSEDTFPARDWLRHAHYSLTGHGAEAVLANTAVPAKTAQWMNTMAKPSLLSEVLQNGNFGEAKKVEAPNFLLALTSEVDHGRASSDPVPSNIHVIEVGRGENHEGGPHLAEEVCVIMPSIDVNRADYTAQLLHERAGMRADIVIAHDVERQGFIPTLNHVARRSSASWVVYLAEDALPGDAWLRKAHARLSSTDSSLLAFNCGKWHGRVAAFGMVKKSWAYGLYGDQVLYEGYQSHRADNELTAIAKAQDEFIYAPECVLVEHDPHKDTRSSERAASNFRREDARLFRQRFQENFVGLVRPEQLEPFYEEYLDLKAHYAKKGPVLGVP